MSAEKTQKTQYVDIFAIPAMPIENFDQNADPTAPLKPLGKGEYVFDVEFAEPNADQRWQSKISGTGNAYLVAKVVGTIAEGPNKGRKVYDFFRTTNFGGTTMIALLLQGLGVTPSADARQQAIDLSASLPGRVIGEVDIEAYDRNAGVTLFKNEAAFPKVVDDEGNFAGPDYDNEVFQGKDVRFSNRFTGKFRRVE